MAVTNDGELTRLGGLRAELPEKERLVLRAFYLREESVEEARYVLVETGGIEDLLGRLWRPERPGRSAQGSATDSLVGRTEIGFLPKAGPLRPGLSSSNAAVAA